MTRGPRAKGVARAVRDLDQQTALDVSAVRGVLREGGILWPLRPLSTGGVWVAIEWGGEAGRAGGNGEDG
jgi:hypothetical protein